MKPHRKIKSLSISELSCVDKPAQEPALAVIQKRQEDNMNLTISKAQADFSAVVRDIQKRDSCLPYIAMSKATAERPDLHKSAFPMAVISRAAPEISPKVANAQKAAGDFNAKVSEIAKRENIAPYLAMDKARMEAPELFAAAYGR